jgi:hypothetical protein
MGVRETSPLMQRGWSRTATINLVVVAIVLVVVGAFFWFASWPHRLVSRVQLGMTRAETIAAIGRAPDKEERILAFCRQGATWYGNCDEVRASKSALFLVWKAGVDSWVVVGFDAGGKVSYRGQGDN